MYKTDTYLPFLGQAVNGVIGGTDHEFKELHKTFIKSQADNIKWSFNHLITNNNFHAELRVRSKYDSIVNSRLDFERRFFTYTRLYSSFKTQLFNNFFSVGVYKNTRLQTFFNIAGSLVSYWKLAHSSQILLVSEVNFFQQTFFNLAVLGANAELVDIYQVVTPQYFNSYLFFYRTNLARKSYYTRYVENSSIFFSI